MKKLIMLLLISAIHLSVSIPAVAQDDEYSLAVSWAADNGIITADSYGQFEAPDDAASRAQAAAMLSRLNDLDESENGIYYSDVLETDWFYKDVCSVSAAGLMTGDGNMFRPNDSITREEAVVLAGRAFELEFSYSEKNYFTDSADISDWAEAYVYTAANLGIVNGNEYGAFMPFEPIKRRDLLLILYRFSCIDDVAVIVDDDGSVWTPLY